MISIGSTKVCGFEPSIIGIRNYKSSWADCDSDTANMPRLIDDVEWMDPVELGPKDEKFIKALIKAGKKERSHCKFLRQIQVWANITAPRMWWQEYDTYKVGTSAQSTSTMNSLLDGKKEFSLEDFSIPERCTSIDIFNDIIRRLNQFKKMFNAAETQEEKDKWREEAKAILPESFNQMRTVNLNYEVLSNMYRNRRNHRMKEWKTFCDWIERLPLSWMITGSAKED